MEAEQKVPQASRDESRDIAQNFVGMTITEAFYDENQLVLELDKKVRIQFSPEGLYVSAIRQ